METWAAFRDLWYSLGRFGDEYEDHVLRFLSAWLVTCSSMGGRVLIIAGNLLCFSSFEF